MILPNGSSFKVIFDVGAINSFPIDRIKMVILAELIFVYRSTCKMTIG